MVLQTSETQKPYKICTKVIKSREKKKIQYIPLQRNRVAIQ